MSLVERLTERTRKDNLDELVHALHDMETLIRATWAASGRVATAFAAAEQAEGFSPLVGHQFVAQISRTSLSISDALSHTAEGHRFLRRVATKLGYDTTAYGDAATEPHEAFTGASAGQAREVA